MDYEIVKMGLQAINMAGTVGLWIWLRIDRRNDKTDERVTDLASKLDKLDKDVSSLEAVVNSAPNHDHLAKVYESINDLSKTVNQLVGENRGQSDTLRLILNQITEKGMR